MSIQEVRQMLGNVASLEARLWEMKGEVVSRDKKWELAREIEFQFSQYHWLIGRCYAVAKVKVPAVKDKLDFKGFVNYVLTDEDKTAYSQWDVDDHDLFLLVGGHQQCGYKLSVSFNPKNDTFNATYMCNDETSSNAGLCLSAFAPDWYNAVKILAFKHDVILDGNWILDGKQQRSLWG